MKQVVLPITEHTSKLYELTGFLQERWKHRGKTYSIVDLGKYYDWTPYKIEVARIFRFRSPDVLGRYKTFEEAYEAIRKGDFQWSD